MKKQILDFTPLILFFVAYFVTKDFVLSTLILVGATTVQLVLSWIFFKRIEKMQWIPFVILLPLAGLTVAFNDERFLKWKPSVVNWLFAVILWLSAWLFKKNWVQVAIEAALRANHDLHLNTAGVHWPRVNFYTGLFFFLTGVINIWVAFNFTTDTWVQFKLFGMLTLNAVGMLALFGYLAKHISAAPEDPKDQT